MAASSAIEEGGEEQCRLLRQLDAASSSVARACLARSPASPLALQLAVTGTRDCTLRAASSVAKALARSTVSQGRLGGSLLAFEALMWPEPTVKPRRSIPLLPWPFPAKPEITLVIEAAMGAFREPGRRPC